jgi:hypothetical protein
MRDDRFPRAQVVVDEAVDAEEMEVSLSYREAALLVPPQELAKAADVEPWLRIRNSDALYVSFGVTVIRDEDDQA